MNKKKEFHNFIKIITNLKKIYLNNNKKNFKIKIEFIIIILI